ncbi:MAG: hypothetical protein Ct9H300mP19_19670 [Dehalococcoidia bacterium]|nr:MAG: hypothetical protein Ct9H300mP19_19670 [Dehalococcoidia bacterium]
MRLGTDPVIGIEGRDHGIAVSALHPGNVMVERRGDGKSAQVAMRVRNRLFQQRIWGARLF